ncbi:hypothetical protein [Geovibrio ferrireducens]|uniref:hypothetical protein n=1 Tax=Geovibrio ferrireducens TaxID=46201 RepID=UPI0022465430|nr:hypothetical protein [Geovibrio ferrireducens]
MSEEYKKAIFERLSAENPAFLPTDVIKAVKETPEFSSLSFDDFNQTVFDVFEKSPRAKRFFTMSGV